MSTTSPTRRAPRPSPRPSRWAAAASALAGYRRLPAVAGRAYLPVTFLGRLPVTMIPIGVLTLATTASGSVAVGGLAAAAAAVAEAVGAPLGGALADRLGQRPVLLAVVVLHVLALAAFLVAATAPVAVPVLLAGAAAVGLTVPQVGALSRARWLALSPRDAPTALAFESTADEVGYLLGPALVGAVATLASPHAGLVVAAALVAVFVTAFAVHPTVHATTPAPTPASTPAPTPTRTGAAGSADAGPRRRQDPLVVVPVLGMLAMGTFFGSSQAALTATAEEAGVTSAGALLFASMALGSSATALTIVLVPASVGPWRRWTVGALGLVLGATLMLVAPGIPSLVAATVAAGLAVGVVLVTIFDVAGRRAVPGRGGIAMTLLQSGIVLGVAAGSALAGVLAESAGPHAAYGVGVGAAAVLVLLVAGAVASRRPLPATA